MQQRHVTQRLALAAGLGRGKYPIPPTVATGIVFFLRRRLRRRPQLSLSIPIVRVECVHFFTFNSYPTRTSYPHLI